MPRKKYYVGEENVALGKALSTSGSDDLPLDGIALEGWREVFGQVKRFPYESEEARLLDIECVVTLGLGFLASIEEWDECIKVADWVLDQQEIRDQSKHVSVIHYYKSLSLIKQRLIRSGLDHYLSAATQAMKHPSQKRGVFIDGVHVFIALMPEEEADGITVSPEGLHFARRLLEACHPKRKVPVTLRESASEQQLTWADVHRALAKFL